MLHFGAKKRYLYKSDYGTFMHWVSSTRNGADSGSALDRGRPQPHDFLCPGHTGRIAAQHSAKNGKFSIICTVLHSDALYMNTLTDNSGFHDITLRDVLRSVLLMCSVWTRG